MEYALIAYSGLLLLWQFDGIENPESKIIVKGDFAGFVVAFAWLECIITIGRHPWFRTWNIYILMVFTVFCEFGKILFYYSFFIITAGLGFYVHLHSRYIYKVIIFNLVFYSSLWTINIFGSKIDHFSNSNNWKIFLYFLTKNFSIWWFFNVESAKCAAEHRKILQF